MNRKYDYLFNLVLIGDTGVGKTCLLLRFADHMYIQGFRASIGVDYKESIIELDGKRIKLHISDTAGQERFRGLTPSYYRRADGIIMVYDVTNVESFTHIIERLPDINKHASDGVNKFLVGNKCDLTFDKIVKYDTAKQFADLLGIKFLETSAKDSTNVEQTFHTIAAQIYSRLGPMGRKPAQTISVQLNFENKKSCC